MATTDVRVRLRSPVLLLGCLLALATGLVLGAAGATLGDPPRSSVWVTPTAFATTETPRAVAARFYAALNESLAMGDTAPLAGIVAPDFVDHTVAADDARGLPGAATAVAAIRASRPGERWTVAAVVVDGDRVLVYLAASPMETSHASTTAIEVLRLTHGLVAERWSTWTGGPASGAAECPLKVGRTCVP
jgi:hypothetical protein